jgi:hypothetical protein
VVNCGSSDADDEVDVVIAVMRCGRKRGRMLWKAA